jgi:hypothetical protein
MRRKLLIVCGSALVLAACGTTRPNTNLGAVKADNCNNAATARLKEIVGLDLYHSQAPLPCMSVYRDVQLRPGQDHDLAVAVAISGGGLRAANFALGVLIGLESIGTQQGRSILNEIDYLSTVSGGGLAAGAYISTLLSHQLNAAGNTEPSLYSLETATYGDDGIALRLQANFQRFLWHAAWRLGLGRNEVLQERLDKVVLERSLTLGDVFVPDCAATNAPVNVAACQSIVTNKPVVPYWFANATVVANGAIFPFAPDILSLYRVSGYRHSGETPIDDPYEMPLAVGMTASASFPSFIPPLTLAVNPARDSDIQLLDGGVADNLGVLTALSVLSQDQAKRKVLLVIDAYAGNDVPYQLLQARLSTLGVIHRTALVSLDSWRGRHKYVVAAMARGLAGIGEEWTVIFLSFEDLPLTMAVLREKVASTGTKLKITPAQQADLLNAGKFVVQSERANLCQAFGCANSD